MKYTDQDVGIIESLCCGMFHRIVQHYGRIDKIHLNRDGSFRCHCPIHGATDGKQNFSWDPKIGRWVCFSHSCGPGGAIGFIRAMRTDHDWWSAVEEAAIFSHYVPGTLLKLPPIKVIEPEILYLEETVLEKFKGTHPYWSRIQPWVKEYLQGGYCSERWHVLYGRITLPVRDANGKLLGITTRIATTEPPVDAGSIVQENWKHKYKNYGRTERGGFQKGLILYNFHNAKKYKDLPLLIVEGPFDVARVIEHGYRAVVALQGSDVTRYQWDLLEPFKHLIYALDPDTMEGHKLSRFKEEAKARDIEVSILRLEVDPGDTTREQFIRIFKDHTLS